MASETHDCEFERDFILVELFNIKYKWYPGDKATNWPDEWELDGYEYKVFVLGKEITDEETKKAYFEYVVNEDEILKEMIPKWVEWSK